MQQMCKKWDAIPHISGKNYKEFVVLLLIFQGIYRKVIITFNGIRKGRI
jgi:hypothetical protein